MEQEMEGHSLSLSSSDGQTKRNCKIVRVDFKQLCTNPNKSEVKQLQVHPNITDYPWSLEDIMHSVAGLCSVCLPDMEITAIYNSLTTCSTIIAMTTPQGALDGGDKSRRSKVTANGSSFDAGGQSSSDEPNCFDDIISGDDSSEDECSDNEDRWSVGRERFLTAARARKTLDRNDLSSVGPEHCVLGCAAFLKLPRGSVQVTLLAVRSSFRRLGLGRHLMQMCKDPEVVGLYNALLAFSDPKADGFFQRHGFNDDPILTAQYNSVVDHWENSTLMVYVPPFSTSGLAVGSLKTLTQFHDAYKTWRDTAISNYSSQLGVMERLRHELLLLHTKVQSQDELISELSSQLSSAKEERLTVEREFSVYRKQTQKLLCSAAVEGAEKWIKSAEQQ